MANKLCPQGHGGAYFSLLFIIFISVRRDSRRKKETEATQYSKRPPSYGPPCMRMIKYDLVLKLLKYKNINLSHLIMLRKILLKSLKLTKFAFLN